MQRFEDLILGDLELLDILHHYFFFLHLSFRARISFLLRESRPSVFRLDGVRRL